MRRILKQLRKGLRTACVTAALATCWNVGQTAQAEIVEFSGMVSPTENDISHLFLIYGTGYSQTIQNLDSINLGDFSAGQSTPFTVFDSIGGGREFFWFAAGLYGDISSGQYIEGVNGVTLGIDGTEGDLWSSYFSESEEGVFSQLLNDQPGTLGITSGWWEGWNVDYDSYLEVVDMSALYDFSQASDNGQIYIESEVVPEPITILLFGSGGIFVLYSRHRKD